MSEMSEEKRKEIAAWMEDEDFAGFVDDHHNCKKRIAELEEKAGKVNLTIARMVEQ